MRQKQVGEAREHSTVAYYENQLKRRVVKMWYELLPTLRRHREYKEMARLQRCFWLVRGGFLRLLAYGKAKRRLSGRTERLRQILILRHCYEPLVFLRTFSLRRKANRIKNQSALTFYAERVLVRSFRALFFSALRRSAHRQLNTKATTHYAHTLGTMALSALSTYAPKHRKIRVKRERLHQAIAEIDRRILLRRTFEAIPAFV